MRYFSLFKKQTGLMSRKIYKKIIMLKAKCYFSWMKKKSNYLIQKDGNYPGKFRFWRTSLDPVSVSAVFFPDFKETFLYLLPWIAFTIHYWGSLGLLISW